MIKTTSEFIAIIENIVREKQLNYLDAIMYYIDLENLELESVADLIKANPSLKSKLYENCANLNLVEKVNKLDF